MHYYRVFIHRVYLIISGQGHCYNCVIMSQSGQMAKNWYFSRFHKRGLWFIIIFTSRNKSFCNIFTNTWFSFHVNLMQKKKTNKSRLPNLTKIRVMEILSVFFFSKHTITLTIMPKTPPRTFRIFLLLPKHLQKAQRRTSFNS